MLKPVLQKIFILLLMITLPVFIIKRHKIFRDRTAYVSKHLENKPLEFHDKHFAIIIPSIYSFDKLKQSLRKLLQQNYENYEIILIDPDHNNQTQTDLEILFSQLREDCLQNGQQYFPKYSIMRSYYQAVHNLKDDDIVVHLELGDWLAANTTLTKLSTIFANSDVWLVYSTYIEYPSYAHKFNHQFKEEKWWKLHSRKTEWLSSPLKIYYAGLFKQIKFELAESKTLKPNIQLNIFLLPMVNQSRKHIVYVKEILYYHDEQASQFPEVFVYRPCME